MREFTDIEISLCQKIAEKKRREVEWGDFIYYQSDFGESPIWFVSDTEGRKLSCEAEDTEIFVFPKDAIPLWQEHDCLEWLNKDGWLFRLENSPSPSYGKYYVACFMPNGTPNKKHGKYKYGETPLEALLRAILAILESK